MSSVLVIDDADPVRKVLKRMLEEDGHEVVEAPDGESGIRLFRERNIDLVITDIIMPKKEGIETIIELKQEFPEIKIIAMADSENTEHLVYLRIAMNLGASCAFTKPIEKLKLQDMVRKIIE
jgi:CheY-like chemotaxis protein